MSSYTVNGNTSLFLRQVYTRHELIIITGSIFRHSSYSHVTFQRWELEGSNIFSVVLQIWTPRKGQANPGGFRINILYTDMCRHIDLRTSAANQVVAADKP